MAAPKDNNNLRQNKRISSSVRVRACAHTPTHHTKKHTHNNTTTQRTGDEQEERLPLDDVEAALEDAAHEDGDREDLEVAQHLGRRRPEVELHRKLEVVVDGVQAGRHHEQPVVARVGGKRARRAVHRRPRPPRALCV
jgi:hypothetical protein